MRRDPTKAVKTFVHSTSNWASGWGNPGMSKVLMDREVWERKNWLTDTFGKSGVRWWTDKRGGFWYLNFSKMEDVTLYLLRWE